MSTPTFEDLTKDIPPRLLDRECTKRFLADVSKKLRNWRLLSPYLNCITDAEEHSISESSRDYDEQKQSLLFRWKAMRSTSATYRALIKAISDSSNVNLAEYACELLLKLHEQASDGACTMAPDIPPAVFSYKEKLKSVYKSHNPIVVSDWPPPPTHEYIKLVLVPKDPVQRGDMTESDMYDSVCGNTDNTEEVELEELLTLDVSKRQVILFEGSSGSGKSTLLWHICQKWQSGELFQQFTLVLLVQLRDKAVHEAKELADILPHIPSRSRKSAQFRQSYIDGIEEIQGEGVLTMLDGWDEAPAKFREKNSLLYDLITAPEKFCIEKSVIVVSSRPHACCDLREHSTSRVELRGFTKESRDQYISTVLQPEIAQKFIEEIESIERGGMVDLSHPLNIVNLTHVYSASSLKLPFTPCRITITLLQCYLLRHLWKTQDGKSPKALNSLDDLPHPTSDSFRALCKIAYEGIVNEKYSFTSDDLEEITTLSRTDTPQTLGLLQAVHSLVSTGSSTEYHFLHLSHQELCAAYHVSKLPDAEKSHAKALGEIMKTFFKPAEKREFLSFETVSNYYAALTSLGNLTIANELRSTYHWYDSFDSDRDKHQAEEDLVYYYALEEVSHSDSESALEKEEEEEEEENFESDYESSESAMVQDSVFGKWERRHFAVFQESSGWRYPSFLEFLMESQNPAVVDEVVGKEMMMWVCDDTDGVLPAVVKMASSLESVTCYGFSEGMGSALCHKQHLKKLEVYVFSPIDEVLIMTDFQGLLNVLRTCPSLKDVKIKVRFSESVAAVAASQLANVLKQICLEACTINALDSIQDCAFAALAPGLGSVSTAIVGCQQIGPESLCRLADTFSHSHSLRYLELHVHQYQVEDREFFNSLKNAASLRVLGISGTGVDPPSLSDTSVGKALLSGDLKELASILGLTLPTVVGKVLDIHIFENSFIKVDFTKRHFASVGLVEWHNKYHNYTSDFKPKAVKHKVGSSEIETLSKTLKEVPVKELCLCTHKIGDKGALYLGESLKVASWLEELIVRDCGIGEEGIASLFNGLTENTTLVTLDASFNSFGDSGAIKVARLINHTSVQVLDISSCNVGEKGIEAVATALTANTTLKKLNLYSPDVLSEHSERELAKLLIKNSTLKMLDVNQNPQWLPFPLDFNSHFSIFKVSLSLTQTLMTSVSTTDFYCGIKMSSIIANIEVCRTSPLGQALWSNNMKEAEDILQLHLPPTGEGRKELHMSGNRWLIDYVRSRIEESDTGLRRIRRIESCPESWAELTELNLENQRLGSIGACVLAEFLNQTQLQRLDISCCGIGEEGIVALASALSTNKTIKHLAVGANRISTSGQKALIESFTKNTSLNSLDIQSGRDYTNGQSSDMASFTDNEDNFICKIEQVSCIAKIIIDASIPLGKHLEAEHLKKTDRWGNTIECQLRPTLVTRKTNPNKVLYQYEL